MSDTGDYISREAAIESMYKDAEAHQDHTFWTTQYEALLNIPADDVRPVVRAKWTISEHEYLDCSVCGYSFYTGFDTMREAKEYLESGYTPNYCPNCGADMREES